MRTQCDPFLLEEQWTLKNLCLLSGWLTKASLLLCVCLSVKMSLFSFFLLSFVVPRSLSHPLQLPWLAVNSLSRSEKGKEEKGKAINSKKILRACLFRYLFLSWKYLIKLTVCVQGYCYIPIAIYVSSCWICIYQNTVHLFRLTPVSKYMVEAWLTLVCVCLNDDGHILTTNAALVVVNLHGLGNAIHELLFRFE